MRIHKMKKYTGNENQKEKVEVKFENQNTQSRFKSQQRTLDMNFRKKIKFKIW